MRKKIREEDVNDEKQLDTVEANINTINRGLVLAENAEVDLSPAERKNNTKMLLDIERELTQSGKNIATFADKLGLTYGEDAKVDSLYGGSRRADLLNKVNDLKEVLSTRETNRQKENTTTKAKYTEIHDSYSSPGKVFEDLGLTGKDSSSWSDEVAEVVGYGENIIDKHPHLGSIANIKQMAIKEAGLLADDGAISETLKTASGKSSATAITKDLTDAMHRIYNKAVKSGFITGEKSGVGGGVATSEQLSEIKSEESRKAQGKSKNDTRTDSIPGRTKGLADAENALNTFNDNYARDGKTNVYGRPSSTLDKANYVKWKKLTEKVTSEGRIALTKATFAERSALHTYLKSINK